MNLPLRFRNPHKQLNILNRHPTRKHLHRILKVRFQDDLPHPVDKRRGGRMQDAQASAKVARFALLLLVVVVVVVGFRAEGEDRVGVG